MKTFSPEALSNAPIEADAIPLPNELHTPPVTKIYLHKILQKLVCPTFVQFRVRVLKVQDQNVFIELSFYVIISRTNFKHMRLDVKRDDDMDVPDEDSKSVVEDHDSKLSSLGRLKLRCRNILSDALENCEGMRMSKAEGSQLRLDAIMDKFLPARLREDILNETQQMKPGATYRHKLVVGKKHDGTLHPHYFYVRKLDSGVQLFFVDPEQVVGKRNALRPPICNLMAAEVPEDNKPPKLGIVRFRYRNDKKVNVADLTKATERMLDEGELPDFLESDDFELTFSLQAKAGSQVMQSRHADKWELDRFIRNGRGNLHIDGKAWAQRGVLRSFRRHLREGNFSEFAGY